MPKVQLTGRLAALVGIGAAVSTATLVAFAAPAFAADSNKTTSCTDKVNVRSQPSSSAPVIGSCSAGERVTTDQSRDGFSHLEAKNGWVSNQYIKDASSDADDSSSADPSDDNGPDNDGDDNDDNNSHRDRDRDRDRDSGSSGLLGGGL